VGAWSSGSDTLGGRLDSIGERVEGFGIGLGEGWLAGSDPNPDGTKGARPNPMPVSKPPLKPIDLDVLDTVTGGLPPRPMSPTRGLTWQDVSDLKKASQTAGIHGGVTGALGLGSET
jgi:hypothetical protein